MSITAQRLLAAMDRRGTDQSKLARGIGATQGAISKILLGKTSNSRLLPRIATYLGVSLAWLLGMTEDPDEGMPAPPPPSSVQFVMMPVALPSEDALARMYEGLLEVVDRTAPLDELARELAQLLPTALSQLQGPLTYAPSAQVARSEAGTAALATADLEHSR